MHEKFGSECLTWRSCVGSNFLLLVAYIAVWLLPNFLALGVAASGRYFSYVGASWQLANMTLIAVATAIAAISTLLTGWGTYLLAKPSFEVLKCGATDFHISEKLLVVGLVIFSGAGLFLSFGGTIFEKSYRGPERAWLQYGAWSVTFLIATFLLICNHLSRHPFSLRLAALYLLFSLPFLLSGSRIDFLSGMVGLFIICSVDIRNRLRIRLYQIGLMLIMAAMVAVIIGKFRYSMYEVGLPAQEMWGKSSLNGQMFYLSTVGDIAASVFQVVGHLEKGDIQMPGLAEALHRYLIRLLPGAWFERPGDLLLLLPELPGAGALHSMGEGYLIAGMWGVIFVSSVTGIILGCSIAAKDLWQEHKYPWLGLLFILPWLLLIRGGWYQFFAFFKTFEIMGCLFFLLMAFAFFRKVLCKSAGLKKLLR